MQVFLQMLCKKYQYFYKFITLDPINIIFCKALHYTLWNRCKKMQKLLQKFATFFAKCLHWIYKARSKFIANFMQVLCKLINTNFCWYYQNIVWLQRNCKINCIFYCKLDANKCFVLLRVKPFILHFFATFCSYFFAKRLQVSLVKTIISTFNIVQYFCKKSALSLANRVLNFCKTLIFRTFGAGWKIHQINL